MRPWFDPNKSFFRLRIVWLTIIFIVLVAIWIGYQIANDLELEWSLTFQGFEEFYRLFKFPLVVLGLLIPLGAIFATQHRSEQTRVQNQFANYYRHLEEFIKHCEAIKNQTSFIDVRKAHRLIFPEMENGDSVAAKSAVMLVDEAMHTISDLMSHRTVADLYDSTDLRNIVVESLRSLEVFPKFQNYNEYRSRVFSSELPVELHGTEVEGPLSLYIDFAYNTECVQNILAYRDMVQFDTSVDSNLDYGKINQSMSHILEVRDSRYSDFRREADRVVNE